MLPSFFIFLLKINPIQWFDKNDLSHIIIIAGNCFFYLGLQRLDYSKRPFLTYRWFLSLVDFTKSFQLIVFAEMK